MISLLVTIERHKTIMAAAAVAAIMAVPDKADRLQTVMNREEMKP